MNRQSPRLDAIRLEGRCIHVLRDDLLRGGTKERAVRPYLMHLMEEGCQCAVYASPFCGFAQVALAVAAEELGLGCRIFCAADPARWPAPAAHEYSELARSHGASLELALSLDEAHAAAHRFASDSAGCREIPLGFDDQSSGAS